MRDVICLMGPTASGKTEFACRLQEALPVEIISVDSAMIYQGMDIGTAKPDEALLKRAPHFLIDILKPEEAYSVAAFCEDANTLCEAIIARGNIPLLVGGSMMYFHAFQNGLSALPHSEAAVREKLAERLEKEGLAPLYQALQMVDAVSAKRLHPNDTQRILRALEVYYTNGVPLSSMQDRENTANKKDYRWINMALFPHDRAWLHARIALRFDEMVQLGFVEEVKQLLANNQQLNLDSPAMKSVGYRQALSFLLGECDFETFCKDAKTATRRLAKRQLTWLRSWPNVHYFEPRDAACFDAMLELIRAMLDNQPIREEGV